MWCSVGNSCAPRPPLFAGLSGPKGKAGKRGKKGNPGQKGDSGTPGPKVGQYTSRTTLRLIE